MFVVAGGGNASFPPGIVVKAGASSCAAACGAMATGAGPAWKGLVISAGRGLQCCGLEPQLGVSFAKGKLGQPLPQQPEVLVVEPS